MIPMSSRWQNFPDRHLRRVLYPGGREQHRFGFPEQRYRDCDAILAPGGTSGPPCVVPEAACAWSIPRAIATAPVLSSMIPDPGPWLTPPVSSAKEAHALDHGKDPRSPGSGHIAAEEHYQAVTLVLVMLSDPSPYGRWRGAARSRVAWGRQSPQDRWMPSCCLH